MSANGAILTVRGLRTEFSTEDGVVRAVDGVSFAIAPRQTFALVGESGCGKSVTALSIMGLVDRPAGRIAGGEILLEDLRLTDLSDAQMRRVRGGRIAMIFQEPMTSLNPVFTVGSQIVEAIRLHRRLPRRAARDLAVETLAQVGIPDPAQRFREYPHQLSGGMRQRVMIAMALSCDPELLIADEPTTALDVTIQAQILDLMKDLQRRRGLSILLITHDLAVVAETADVVAVMYASKLAELAGVRALFEKPLHPYTQGLFRSLPRLGEQKNRLETIPGSVPNPLAFPKGCKFHPRCPIGCNLERCRTLEPDLREVADKHWAACWECPGYKEGYPSDPSSAPLTKPGGSDDQ
ncbi:MAG TPA: ABC transporter ATP-binding protein [Phycisphaerae bacterium]|nr:ABC transporter ATP-binding protein [Phycisphaerae bacterium]HUU22358.1 ABC transporter ATP-binding protein [Phycisphaerae bacterium]